MKIERETASVQAGVKAPAIRTVNTGAKLGLSGPLLRSGFWHFFDQTEDKTVVK